MRLLPFCKYFGSKNRSAKLYPAPQHKLIEEDFAGMAGYSCNYPEHDVILRDSDPRVVEIWKYLIGASPETILRLPLMEPGQHIDTLDVCHGARLFISCCINTSPFRNVLTSWKDGNNDGLWGEKWREKVASQVEAIKHWRVECRSYSDPRLDVVSTKFVDPPYEGLDVHYSASKQNPIDYAHLGVWCRTRRGQVIVCERTGAKWLPFEHLANVAAVRNSGGRACSEAIWTNEGLEVEQTPVFPQQPKGQVALFGA